MLYVLIKITTLTRVFCTVKLTDKVRLVGTYHGQRMCVLGLVRSGQRDKPKGIGRAWCVRLAVLITAAVSLLASSFLLVPLKKIRLCMRRSLLI